MVSLISYSTWKRTKENTASFQSFTSISSDNGRLGVLTFSAEDDRERGCFFLMTFIDTDAESTYTDSTKKLEDKKGKKTEKRHN